MHLSSPNRIVWNYFAALRRLALRASQGPDDDERKQDLALCIILSVTAIESFVNVYFRVIVSESGLERHLAKLESDLKAQVPLMKKLTSWTKAMLGEQFDLSAAPGAAFDELRKRRNKLIHFTSSHQSIAGPGFAIHGLADISAYDSLKPQDGMHAVAVAEGVISELFRLRGIPGDQIPHMLHAWTGKVPV